MNSTSLITNRYTYQDFFGEDGYVRDGGFNILHLDRHGGFTGTLTFLLSWVVNFLHSQNLYVILHLWYGLKCYQAPM